MAQTFVNLNHNSYNQTSSLLEHGHVVYFPTCPIPLPTEDEQNFLRNELAHHLSRKNVSYYAESKVVRGLKSNSAIRSKVLNALSNHGKYVVNFLNDVIPDLMQDVRFATCSFRPVEEEGRKLSAHASNELIHVDAAAYGATHGDRILRFFVNLNEVEDRVWISKGPLHKHFHEWGPAAGFPNAGLGSKIDENYATKLYSNGLRALSKIVPLAQHLLDTSPYDRAMRRLHNYMKDSPEFQKSPNVEQFQFKPFSSWMTFTDAVSHACVSGRFALVSTFIVPMKNCNFKNLVPFHILRGSVRE